MTESTAAPKDEGILRLGIDVGSTTVKVVVATPDTGEALYSRYVRHNARQPETVCRLLEETEAAFPHRKFLTAVCGSGGKTIAEKLQVHYIQEVVANSAAVKKLYPNVKTAVELGGQDAKVIFFYYDNRKKKLQTSDMRMNGSCAGGTGAFIDEIAALLNVKTEQFDRLAAQGTTEYEISGRCGVFAKTDIQPLLLSGAKREDIALSAFHAIVKQTIGGLAQGLELKAPIIFEGGPLTFHKTLIRVFKERLRLSDEDIIVPKHPETIVAYGTAIAIDQLFPEEALTDRATDIRTLAERLRQPGVHALGHTQKKTNEDGRQAPFFASENEKREFMTRHDNEIKDVATPQIDGRQLLVYLGIDSGSTTSKIILLDEKNQVIDRYYANNNGEPLLTVKNGLHHLRKKYEAMGVTLTVLGAGTTGYGEKMLAKAFGADYHTVETVAHTCGCVRYYPDTTFLLDIGGQDMKAIWLEHGIITNIMLNEACSSGCGSFLENFAVNLKIPVTAIADAAFQSENPAKLGSRCTVFMNSTIINEQRNGKKPNDIMAGLCRSIIENVFTKVVRISDASQLGEHVTVQGGTFRNRAVLRALEEYLGREVRLAPYPGEMGAIGAALATREHIEEYGYENGKCSSFIGFSNVENFSSDTQTGVICQGCTNHCNRTVISFSTGQKWISGNRCEKGAADTPAESAVKNGTMDLFSEREKLLFSDYPYQQVAADKNQTVGLPRVLEFWDSMPFWNTFFKALGYQTVFSHKSSRKLYEQGLQYVASDTICFPAKLVHGHIIDLQKQNAERIFFPYVMHMPPEGVDQLSPYVCSVLQGYPMVIKNSQNPSENGTAIFDTPIFHWFSAKDRKKQICQYAVNELGVKKKEAEAAFHYGEQALSVFRKSLVRMGEKILDDAHQNGTCAVVLAGRPYHNDPFICHDIYKRFEEQRIPVLTVDALPDAGKQDLGNTKIEITNNFHTRMLEAAMVAAKDPALEYVQIVSFGCGHDAILSDEIIRILAEVGNKSPLILKVDESDAAGSLGIRIRSFIETLRIRRNGLFSKEKTEKAITGLSSPSPAKFYRADKKKRTLLIPNISKEVSSLLCGICEKEGFLVKSIPLGGTEEIALGKKYVHNDICFPAQMVIGELIGALQKGNYRQDEVAVGMVKFQCDCRMSHYAGLLRKGLDKAGFTEVPIVTTDANDTKDMHPGVFLLGISAVLEAVWVFMMLDILTDLCRKIRPYEMHTGETNRIYEECVDMLAEGIKKGIGNAKKVFSDCLDKMDQIPHDRSHLKPVVFITGELLVTYHPGSNFHIEEYMEANGMETVFPRITDQLRKDFDASICEIRDYNANIPPYPYAVDFLFNYVQKQLEKIAQKHTLYQKTLKPADMYRDVSDIIPETLSCGEGWLMAAEIAHYAKAGVKSFIILQPFGCLPNHVCGRGVIKSLKEKFPDISILPLDLDPDTSYANVENRLQMLIMNQ